MTLEQLLDLWKQDCTVDKTELADESLKTITLHGKYMEIYKKEKLILIRLQKELPKLKLSKYVFYTIGPDEETQKLGWKLPPRGAVIKSEVGDYLAADDDLISANLKIAIQQEKVDLLGDIVKEVQNRRWSIRAAIDFMKWTAGG